MILLLSFLLIWFGVGIMNLYFFFYSFCMMFFVFVGIGVVFVFVSVLFFKYVDLRKNFLLEFGMMLVFIYVLYVLVEGMYLFGMLSF